MSRIGNKLINIPENVEVTLNGNNLNVNGPLGKLSLVIPKELTLEIKDKQLLLKREDDTDRIKALHGLVRSEIQNIITGVTVGWSKTLKLVGVGFRAQTDGKKLTLFVGFSHPVEFIVPDGITVKVTGSEITISGIDKRLVGETSARIRSIKPPDAYKGKGIRYKDEIIHLKPGKVVKTVGGVTPTK